MTKLFVTLFVLQSTLLTKVKARRDAGQGTLEYVAMIAVAAVIIAAVVAAMGPAKGAVEGLIQAAIAKLQQAGG
jgi:hypothetical protein